MNTRTNKVFNHVVLFSYMPLKQLRTELKKAADPKRAEISKRFFKTGKGEYGEGDVFIGLTAAQIRELAKKYQSLEQKDVAVLLNSKIHEERSTGLIILVNQYKKANTQEKENLVTFYLGKTKHINNWDLVDVSAPYILGAFISENKSRASILYDLAKSKDLWEKRIAIVSTWMLIRNGMYEDTLKLSKIFLNEEHDLMHKAVGWMLREVGKKDLATLEKFLMQNYKRMPRTMLRYAIEKFPERKRQLYLKGTL